MAAQETLSKHHPETSWCRSNSIFLTADSGGRPKLTWARKTHREESGSTDAKQSPGADCAAATGLFDKNMGTLSKCRLSKRRRSAALGRNLWPRAEGGKPWGTTSIVSAVSAVDIPLLVIGRSAMRNPCPWVLASQAVEPKRYLKRSVFYRRSGRTRVIHQQLLEFAPPAAVPRHPRDVQRVVAASSIAATTRCTWRCDVVVYRGLEVAEFEDL